MKKIINTILVISLLTICLSSCHIGRMIIYNAADVNDYKIFPQVTIEKPETNFQFTDKSLPNFNESYFPNEEITNKKITDFPTLFSKTKTTSFMVIRNDNIIYENYFLENDSSSIFTSFSVAKSFISALVGIAIVEGKITSVKDPITKYLPDFKDKNFNKITLEHLLNMESGIRFRENYANPFAEIGRYYYGKNLRKYVYNLKAKEEPGQKYDYKSVNTLLLGMAIEKACNTTLTEYFTEKLWLPLEMEFDATLNIDSENDTMVKSYCCVNARTRDFAKLGRLYLNNGKWNGKQIVSQNWVKQSTTYPSNCNEDIHYTYQWRVDKSGNFYAQGHLGQYIFVNPEKEIIIVRTGKTKGGEDWPKLFAEIIKKM